MKLSRLFKQLFRRRQPDKVGSYIDGIPAIQALIREDLLYVEPKTPHVTLSVRLHMAYMDNEEKLSRWTYRLLLRLGLVERDRRYRALMEHVLAYINFERARLKLPLHEPNKPLRFVVMNLDVSHPLLLGVYQYGLVGFKLCEDIEDRLEAVNKKRKGAL